jgi:hypothetical protein
MTLSVSQRVLRDLRILPSAERRHHEAYGTGHYAGDYQKSEDSRPNHGPVTGRFKQKQPPPCPIPHPVQYNAIDLNHPRFHDLY